MSSPPPKDWQEQVRSGLGEGKIIGEEKSQYYKLLLAVSKFADEHNSSYTEVMMDILEAWCRDNHIKLVD